MSHYDRCYKTPLHSPLNLAFYEISAPLKINSKSSDKEKAGIKKVLLKFALIWIFSLMDIILLCKCYCSTFGLLGILLIASCAPSTAAASCLLPDFCFPFYMCFLLLCFLLWESPPASSSVFLTFHPIISAVTPPQSISPSLSPPSLDYPLGFCPALPEFTAFHQFCPCSLALIFIFHQSPLILFFFLLFIFFLYMMFWYITISHHHLIKKLVANENHIYQCSLAHREVLPEKTNMNNNLRFVT